MPKIAILILAAGASSRMGDSDKLTQDANGTPLLARVIERAGATSLPVFVTLPDLSHPRANLAHATDATLIAVPDWRSGMSASIKAGIAALPDNTPGVMILPGDMPDLTTTDLQAVAHTAQTHPASIIRATTPDGTAGHPVIFPNDLFAQLQNLTGDLGARAVIRAHQQRLHPHIITGTRALTDLDTPQDWANWRAAQT
ncbi:MAG: 4-diphosphocytidyl-2C-methyl-D-erythritol synthase [Rhodobacteraceae bacterium]|nr:MAG: 4-diphosphocytidyl-2C-methyl-D-erythritol synthase [Paracoccaceae bacterium]